MKKRFLLFCGSLLVCSSAFVSLSNNVLARDVITGPIWNNDHAKRVCPGVCRNRNWKWTGEWHTTIRNEQSVCGCGEWRLENGGLSHRQFTKAELYRYRDFKTAIQHRGLHPRDAASSWDSNYKLLERKNNQYQIRLSLNNRVTFTVDDKNKVVRILQVGGHTR